MLVVVENRDVEQALELALYLKAARSGYVLEVDAAVGRRDGAHGGDYLLCVLGVETDWHGVDAAKLLEEQRLALHDGQGGERADIAEAQHGGAVGDDGHHVAARGVLPHRLGVCGYFPAGLSHAGGVGRGKVVPVFDRDFAFYLYLSVVLAVHPEGERIVVLAAHLHSPQG